MEPVSADSSTRAWGSKRTADREMPSARQIRGCEWPWRVFAWLTGRNPGPMGPAADAAVAQLHGCREVERGDTLDRQDSGLGKSSIEGL
jgi:hypothetical protein